MSKDYNDTLNLPKTDFPMRAGLPKREPELLKTFYDNKIYEKLIKKNADKPAYILHDGPPFSNGDIHLGHALNKILKDIIVRSKNMTGFFAPYIPGWDNHGMPIEREIIKKHKLDREKMTIPEFRDACHKFAENYVDRQREQFKRLGVIGDWDNPYLTMSPQFEAEEVKIFGKMYEGGYIYKGLRPVYWCASDQTALAEAEIEYADTSCTAIYVRFKVMDSKGLLEGLPFADNAYVLIWTTTPWTLPGNLAICLNENIEYAVCSAGDQLHIIATDLVEDVYKKLNITDYKTVKKLKGSELEYVTTKHPLYDRESLLILGDHVTTDVGTGCVHTSPGHGADDFNVCQKYPTIKTFTPVDHKGVMTGDAGRYEGMYYSKCSESVISDLEACGALMASEEIEHAYPHCWRCKNPVIFRATEQWFASVNAMKDKAVAACHDIKWIPEWGKDRMIAMLVERSDWCISRQRHWGLPIPVFYCNSCEEPLCTPDTIDAVSKLFREKGSNAWYENDASDILPGNAVCSKCSATEFIKGDDTLDCWFDSGSTHADALSSGNFKDSRFPADLYIEGGDQYRGWFQSSMLTSIAANGVAPYKQIITHGWTVDGEGKAMHKSLGNAVSPDQVLNEYGADILRLWVASSDYRADTKMSKEILKQLSDIYLKIRNTARFFLGNLEGFNPNEPVAYEDMPELDHWALSKLNKLVKTVKSSYENYEYHIIYHAVHNFCTIDMSNFYMDVIKDRLYCDVANGLSRRSAQTTIYIILDSLVRIIAPILAFTSEEIWAAMTHRSDVEKESILLNQMPMPSEKYAFSKENEAKWDKLLRLRLDINKALENARSSNIIGKPLDADVTVYDVDSSLTFLSEFCSGSEGSSNNAISELFIVSSLSIISGKGEGMAGREFSGISIDVKRSDAPKCARCWAHRREVGAAADHPMLCPRCVEAVRSL